MNQEFSHSRKSNKTINRFSMQNNLRFYIRKYHSYSDLADKFVINASTVCREIHFITPRLYPLIQTIQFPLNGFNTNLSFNGATLAIDCSPHAR